MRSFVTLLAIPVLLPAADRIEDPLRQLTERMAQMEASRAASLEHYSVTRHYTLDNARFKSHAEMTVRMTYTAPDKKTFEVLSESGTGWIRSHVLRRLMQTEMDNAPRAARQEFRVAPDNYDLRLLGTETAGGRSCYVLEAVPKTRNKYLFRGRVWVDAEDAAVARIEGSPAQNPSFWTTSVHFIHQYAKFGPYWLTSSDVSESEIRIFGQTELRIEYVDYVINPPRSDP